MKKIVTTLIGWYINALAHVAPRKAGEQGFKIFCRPFRLTLKDHQKKFLYTADLFSFDHDGIPIQAYRWGNGPKNVLFLHGWQSHSFRWKAYIDSLDKDEYTVYAFDAPGHGLSGGNYLNVPFYGNVITQLIETIGEVHAVVGHSLGSFSSLYMLHQRPSLKINKLIVMAPPGEASDFIDFYQATLGLSGKSIRLINDHFFKEFQKPISWFSTQKFASTIQIPGLVIHDVGDLEAPYQYATRIHHVWDKSNLLTTKGLGHNLKSEDVIKAVTRFIENDDFVQHGNGRMLRDVEAY